MKERELMPCDSAFGRKDELPSNVAIEQAYRRGFHQGVFAAIDAIEDGFSVRQLHAWNKRLHKWRLKRHGGKWESPEWLSRSELEPE